MARVTINRDGILNCEGCLFDFITGQDYYTANLSPSACSEHDATIGLCTVKGIYTLYASPFQSTFRLEVEPVPLPGAGLLLGSAILGLLIVRKVLTR